MAYKVINSRSFKSKDGSKSYYVVDVLSDDGNVVTDCFVNGLISAGTIVKPVVSIVNHKFVVNVEV